MLPPEERSRRKPMNKPAQRTIEERIREIEDRLEILNLIASHPPSADTGADFYARAVYAEDGIFDRGDKPGGRSREEYGELMTSAEHTKALEGGLGHFASLPYVELDGDRAFVTSYLQILTPAQGAEPVAVPNHGSSKGFRIHRLAANRWELKRTAQGWRIARRTLRALDGNAEARALLKGALGKYAAAG
jgi:hypothetical protein